MISLSLGPLPPEIKSTATMYDYAISTAPKEALEALDGRISIWTFWRIPILLKQIAETYYKYLAFSHRTYNANDPQLRLVAKRLFTMSDATFTVIIGNIIRVSIYEIGKNEGLFQSSSLQDQLSSLLSITQTIKKLAENALEEWAECYKRMAYGEAMLKQCIGVTTVDESKCICLGQDIDGLKTNGEHFLHLLKIAPPEITQSMQYLKRYQVEKREEVDKIWCGLTDLKRLIIYKAALHIIDEVVKTFTLRTDIDSVEELIKMIFEFNMSPLKEIKQEVAYYERKYKLLSL
jgi:hypothetical protein